MKKTLYAILTGLGILAGGVFIARAAVNCGQVFPTSLNGYTSNCIIPSSWAQALEAKIGTTGSAVTSSLDYQINDIFTSYGSEIIASSSLPWLNFFTATAPSSTWFQVANNLSEILNTSTARNNLGLGNIATLSSSTFLKVANNLSDLTSTSSARTNIGYSAGTNIGISGLGAISFSGVLPIANGGTATATVPTNAQFLSASSSIPTWKTFVAGNNISITNTPTSTQISAVNSSTAAGTEGQIQYNEGGTFGATSTFTFTSSTETLAVPNITFNGTLTGTLPALANANATGTATVNNNSSFNNLATTTIITGAHTLFIAVSGYLDYLAVSTSTFEITLDGTPVGTTIKNGCLVSCTGNFIPFSFNYVTVVTATTHNVDLLVQSNSGNIAFWNVSLKEMY